MVARVLREAAVAQRELLLVHAVRRSFARLADGSGLADVDARLVGSKVARAGDEGIDERLHVARVDRAKVGAHPRALLKVGEIGRAHV